MDCLEKETSQPGKENTLKYKFVM